MFCTDFGYDGALFACYVLGGARSEAEVSYKKAQINDGRFAVPVPGDPLVGGPPDDDATGSTSALAFMVNGMLDIGDDEGLQGFIGGGIGYAKIKAKKWPRFDNAAPFLDDSDSSLAWQAIDGFRSPLTANIH